MAERSGRERDRIAYHGSLIRRAHEFSKPSYARAVVFRRAIYTIGGSTTAGDVHGTPGSRIAERYVP